MSTVRKPSKYRAVKTEYMGVLYDSRAEAKRAAELDMLVKTDSILWWIRQPPFTLGVPENKYRPDFLVVRHDGVHVEDVKGVRTAKFNRDVKLWRKYGPCPLHIVGKTFEIIFPERLEGKGQSS